MEKRIILTGGGTAGHVTPNQALIPKLLESEYHIHYIGSKNGMEKDIIAKEKNVKYHSISCGKLRRYIDLKNISDPFKVVKGIFDSILIIKRIKPEIVFSKGGFVALPVVIAAKFLAIPVISHESDYTPGLANKLSKPYVRKICVSFKESLRYVGEKGVLTGTPIREEIGKGNIVKAKKFLQFEDNKPILLVTGGSQGSKMLNEGIRFVLDELTKKFNVIHLCGKGNLDLNIKNKSYRQYEYISNELPDLLMVSDIIVSRAGANFIFEILYLNKPNVLIPLVKGSRGDQILNAKSFKEKGYSVVLDEENIKNEIVITLKKLYEEKEEYIKVMKKSEIRNGTDNILELIDKYKKIQKK